MKVDPRCAPRYGRDAESSTYNAPVPPSTGFADTNATTADVRLSTPLTSCFNTGPRLPERNREKSAQSVRGLCHGEPVQIQLAFYRVLSAPQPADYRVAHARPAERQ